MLSIKFFELIKSDVSDDEKYNKFLELLPQVKKCAKCNEYLLKCQFKQGYCVPCRTSYSKKYRLEKSKEATRHCGLCNKTKDASEFYGTSLYRCKDCTKKKQSDYSMKYYYTSGRDRRRKITKFYLDNQDKVDVQS